MPCESLIYNLHFFLCLFLTGNNSVEGFLEVIFLFKITHIFCWTIDDKPLSDLFSINGVVRFCTNSHPKSNEFVFRGSSFLFKAKIVDAFIRLLSKIYENAAVVFVAFYLAGVILSSLIYNICLSFCKVINFINLTGFFPSSRVTAKSGFRVESNSTFRFPVLFVSTK